MSAAGGYVPFLHIFINVHHTERMSEFEVINIVNMTETYRVGINAGSCTVDRMDATVTA